MGMRRLVDMRQACTSDSDKSTRTSETITLLSTAWRLVSIRTSILPDENEGGRKRHMISIGGYNQSNLIKTRPA